MEGRRLGRYRITSKLAEGGMGAVYLATHELMGREVVIKVLLPEMSTQREIVQRSSSSSPRLRDQSSHSSTTACRTMPS